MIERGTRAVAGVDVKVGATVTAADFRGLRKLKAATGGRFAGGVVVYDGEMCVSHGDGLYAVPISLALGDRNFMNGEGPAAEGGLLAAELEGRQYRAFRRPKEYLAAWKQDVAHLRLQKVQGSD